MLFFRGQPFPSFSLPCALPDGQEKNLSGEMLYGQKWVLFVYPKDHTCGCTLEATQFRDLQAQFSALGVQIYGLSRDSIRSHFNFQSKHELSFPLLADSGGVWMKTHGLIFNAKLYGKPVTKVARTTFLIDRTGVIEQIWENVSPSGHAQEVLDFIARST